MIAMQEPSVSKRLTAAGFTLIELLVVIAIIALLASLIVPGVSRSMESARNTDCMNNLRQIGAAIITYASEHDGQLPPTGFYGVTPYYNRDARNFINSLRGYLNYPASNTWSTNYRNCEFGPVFDCPSYKGPTGGKCYGLLSSAKDTEGNTVKPWGFIINASGSTLSPKPAYIDEIQPTEIAMRDSDGNGQVSHRKHRNALFFDFHVGRLNLDNEPL